MLASYQGVGGFGRTHVLASYLGVGGCREEKCVSLLPHVGVEEKCVSLLPRCGWVRKEKCVSLLPRRGWVSGGEMC